MTDGLFPSKTINIRGLSKKFVDTCNFNISPITTLLSGKYYNIQIETIINIIY